MLFGAAGCAYYNGLYNARGLVKRAESAVREGRDSVAIAAWREAAAKADTVATRYPNSRWTDDALLLAGVSAALAGNCVHGLERLAQWQRHPNAGTGAREKVRVARGACLARQGYNAQALDSLMPAARSSDETLSRIAAAWAARAALAAGHGDTAVMLAAIARSDALDAELATAAIASHRVATAERLLSQRAADWRALRLLHGALASLANAGRLASVDTVVSLTASGRGTRAERAALLIAAGTWAERGGRVERARARYELALELANDTTTAASATVRLSLLEIRGAPTLDAARSRIDRAKGRLADAPEIQRADSAVRLASRLVEMADSTGARLFLAAEVARDRVESPSLARTLFLRAAREHPTSSLAPKALLAAAALTPDSAGTWRQLVRTRYAASPYAQALEGSTVPPAALERDDRLLRQTWDGVVAADTSSLVSQRARP
jgi:tetratricopeptide (TPR) repeat protein